MNSCIYCKFARKGLEECLCYAKCNMQESDFTFKIPQQINFSCEYCEPISKYEGLFYYDNEGNPHIKETNYVWDGIWK